MFEPENDCIAFSLKFATPGGVPALVEATKRQMYECRIPDARVDAICRVIEEVLLDILPR